MTLTRPIKALHRIREYILAEPDSDISRRAHEDKDLFSHFEERILVSVQSLVELVVGLWDGQQVRVLICSFMAMIFFWFLFHFSAIF